MSTSAATRDSNFRLCCAREACYPCDLSVRIDVSIPTLNRLPCLTVCMSRRLLPIPRTRPANFQVTLLLLLSGDVNLNPGPVIHGSAPTETHNIRVATTNVQSIREKSAAVSDLVTSKQLDVLAITETWLTPDETDSSIADITPTGYNFFHRPRQERTSSGAWRTGGGAGLLISDKFKAYAHSIPTYTSFDAICTEIRSSSFSGYVVSLYRPQGCATLFLTDLQELLTCLHPLSSDLYILGDFNLHLNKSSTDTSSFNDIMKMFDLKQHVNFPTHITAGNWLDVFITRDSFDAVKRVFPSDSVADHCTVIGELTHKVQTTKPKQKITYRAINKINIDAFKDDILNSDLIQNQKENLSELVTQYDDVLTSTLNKHAPIKTKHILPRAPTPWMTPEILIAKRKKRQLERAWRTSRRQRGVNSYLDKSRYRKQCRKCNNLMSKAKTQYYRNQIENSTSDSRQLWKTINKFLHRIPKPALPDHSSLTSLCDSFSTFFTDKICTIRANFPSSIGRPLNMTPPPVKQKMETLRPASKDEIRKILLSSPNKSCDLDPIPTTLLKACIDILLDPITNIVNMSLDTSIFPSDFKMPHVNPLLKKPGLSKEDLKNYRPVSNLNFVSKILEKVVANRLQEHITTNELSNNNQSAYKQNHSTETALLKIHNDINTNMDQGKVTALTLLDLSAAFDTIDHTTLTNCLSTWFGISGSALTWFSSYLSDRKQKIKILDCFSKPESLKFGVPQGSVLGPVLFTLYTTPLSYVIGNHNLKHHLYADDTQIYISLHAKETTNSLSQLKLCLQDVYLWMTQNKLKLNPDKTEFLLIGNKIQREKFSNFFPVNLLDKETTPTPSARNLGVIFDSDFNFKKHISQTCRSCFYHIKDLRRIRRYLTKSIATTIAIALVSSKLDYCNSLLHNLPDKDIKKLQSIQNSLARVVCRASRFCHVTPLLKSLHWLPVSYRIKFKIATITYKSLTLKQPAYLCNLLKPRSRPQTLRSNNQNYLQVPKTKNSFGTRAFSVSAPSIWNSLPVSVRSANSLPSFRKLLKTHLFGLAFPS